MIIEVDESLTPAHRNEFIKRFQIEYYHAKHGSLAKTAREMGLSARGLREYLRRNRDSFGHRFSTSDEQLVKRRPRVLLYIDTNVSVERQTEAVRYIVGQLRSGHAATNLELIEKIKRLFVK